MLLPTRIDVTVSEQLVDFRCSRCGHRDRVALAKALLIAAVVGAVAAFSFGLVAAEEFRRPGAGGDVGVLVGVATFLAVVVTATALKLRSVRRRVRFHRLDG